MVFGVWFLDNIIRVDDPVGAVAVHCMNGIWGTIAVGLFSTDTVPGYSLANAEGEKLLGLFYGGGFELLGIQFLGMICTAVFTAVTITIAFSIIRAVFGLRASAEEEITGLDVTEHGLTSAYAGFSIMDITGTQIQANENTDLGIPDYEAAPQAMRDAAVQVAEVRITESRESTAPAVPSAGAGARAEMIPGGKADLSIGMHKVVIITRLSKYDRLTKALNELGVTGMTATQVMGCGLQKGAGERYRGVEIDATLIPKVKIEVVVSKIPVQDVIDTAKKTLYTGHIGDGKIFVYTVDRVVKVRTGEEDYAALQDVE